jgi:predicted AlkP superfamily pyrophosphatase or phosphodiesterase
MRPPRNVVLIGWDGVQRDHLKEMIALGQMPNLMELAAQGNLVAIDITRTTDTKAGWAQILTGYEPETTGVFSDSWFRPVPAGYTAFERLEALFGRDNIYTAAVIAKKDNLGTRSPSPDGTFPGEPYYFTQNNMDLFVNGLGAADNVGARALQVLDEHGRGRFFLFVHFQEPDIQGHSYGENSAEYSAAVRHNDEWLGRIVAELEELGVRRETSVYVCSDHGFDEGLKTHSDAPYVFLATDDLLVKRRGLREDIAPTILWRFGLNLWAVSPPLDGHPLQMIYRAPDW